MSYAPASLLTLRQYLQTRTHLSPVSLGIVGDSKHHSGYHLGRDRIRDIHTDYSTTTVRDRAGLTDAASAMDIGSFPHLREFSVWLVHYCQHNGAGSQDIREIIYSPDGVAVLRYDRARGIASHPRSGEADDSHRTHTHISWYRDSQNRTKLVPFAAYFDKAPAVSRYQVQITAPTRLYDAPGGTLVGTVSAATYICTRVKHHDVWWFVIAIGKRKGQAFQVSSNRMTVKAI